MRCKRCDFSCVKAGKQGNGKQKFLCKKCCLYQQKEYAYSAYKLDVHDQFSRMNRLGCGTNNMARFLGISITTLQKWIRKALDLEPDYSWNPGLDQECEQQYAGCEPRSGRRRERPVSEPQCGTRRLRLQSALF